MSTLEPALPVRTFRRAVAATALDRDLLTLLRAHQRTAVDMCVNAFVTGAPRLTLQAACGTGKTLMALHVAHEVAPAGRVLTILPRLQLLEQTLAAWHAEGRPGRYLALSSEGPQDPALADVMVRTGNLDVLAEQIAGADGPVNVFTTYQSLHKIARGHAEHRLPAWDLIIGDEAHRAAGKLSKAWAVIHDNHAIPARRRLYMTATPKNVADPEDNRELTCEVASMDDMSLYGPVVYRISLAESIEQGLLADYRLVVMEIHDEDLRRILARNSDITPDSEGLRVAAAQVALLYAMHKHDLRRTLSFHTRIRSAEIFAESLPETAALMPKDTHSELWTGTVSSLQDRFDRRATFAQFAEHAFCSTAGGSAALRRAVLTNSRLCLEGIDVPAIDSILFADPKSSTIDIVQAVGRALRQVPGTGKIATIIVPVYLAPGEDPGQGMKGSPYYLLYQVMIALKVYDEHVVHRIEYLELDGLDREVRFRPPAARPERAGEVIPLLTLSALDPHHSVWPIGLASAERYHVEHGHLDVPS
ncbi:DEAD/DEAH box helicase family protein, partial [Kitasatospora sp. NPDC093558]|uniref:DEAD/DEAH box helicase family protein n=1 Tax=Kitasatospora sp. NPDC093558 TaxID=3155201 RepID=UPI0034151A9B